MSDFPNLKKYPIMKVPRCFWLAVGKPEERPVIAFAKHIIPPWVLAAQGTTKDRPERQPRFMIRRRCREGKALELTGDTWFDHLAWTTSIPPADFDGPGLPLSHRMKARLKAHFYACHELGRVRGTPEDVEAAVTLVEGA